MRPSRVLLLGLLALAAGEAFAAAYFTRASGNWNVNGTWSTAGCGGAAAGAFPGAADTATICTGHTVTVTANAAASAVTLNAPAAANGITVNAGTTLAVTGAMTMNSPTAGVSQTLSILGTVTTGANLTIPGSGTAGRNCIVSLDGGTLAVTGTLNFSGTAAQAQLTASNASTVRVTANFGTATGTPTWSTNSTLELNGAGGTQTIGVYTGARAYGIVKMNNATGSMLLTAGTTTIAGDLWVAAGTADIRSATLTVSGTTDVDAGATLTFTTPATGAKIFVGRVTINGSWSNPINESPTFRGGLRNNNSFSSGTGTYTFNTNSQSIDGTATMTFAGTVAIVGAITVTNANTNAAGITASGAITGSVAGSTWLQGGDCTPANSSYLKVSGAMLATGTINATAACNTVEYAGAGPQTVKYNAAATTYHHFKTSGAGTKTFQAFTLQVNGDFTHNATSTATALAAFNVDGNFGIGAGATFSAGTFTHVVGGNWSNSGAFTAGTSTVTLDGSGASAQDLGGASATTFYGLTANYTGTGAGVTITTAPTVNNTLTLTSGKLLLASCASSPVVLGTAGVTAGGSTTSYVQGPLRKNFAAGGTLNFRAGAGLDEFPVGTASAYSPIEITAGTAGAAGNLTVCAVATEHPQMSQANGGGIDTAKSVNRYWSMTAAGGLTLSALMDATFKFVAGDVDGGATTANFIAERYDGTDWNPTTLVSAGATSTQVQNVNLTPGTNEFAIGEPLAGFPPTLGSFNAFDTTTPAGAVIGNIQTRQSGVTFTVRLVRILNNAVNTGYNQAGVTVELYDASDNTGGYSGTTACRTTWTAIAGTSQTVTFVAGVVNATFTAGSTMTGNSFRDVRVHVVKTGAGAGEGCSSDRFAIRPTSLTVSGRDTDWQSAGTGRALANTAATGGNVHAASEAAAATPRPFTLRASPQPATATNYDGSPTLVAGYPVCCTPSTTPACATLPAACTAGTLSFTGGSWTAAGSGVRDNATAHYAEAGVMNVQLEDATYASVDANDGSSAATRTIAATATAPIGRFVPERFAFTSPSTPAFRTYDASCSGTRSFTYIGQAFWYVTGQLPSATVNAVNANGTVTTNYRGVLFKLAASGLAETYSNNGTGPSLDVAAIGTAALTGVGNGTATYGAASGGLLAYARSTTAVIPADSSPFGANLSLTVNATDSSENGVSGNPGNGMTPALTSTTALDFNGGGSGVAFDGGTFAAHTPNISGGKAFVYGRLRLLNASGVAYLALAVPARAEFWTGVGFKLNTDDHCTALARANVALGAYARNLNACETMVSPATVTVASGVGSILLAAPGATNEGSVNLTPQLGSPVSGVYCPSVGGSETAATGAGMSYMQGAWTGTTYDQNPTARGAFGAYGAWPRSFIFLRENY